LPFAGLPGQTGYGAGARWYVLAGATVYTAGWVLAGSAVALSGVLNFGDGVLLMFAAPLLGVVGLLVDPLQTIGAVLVFAAGIGIAVRAGRLLPVGRRGIAAAAAAQAVAAATAAPEKAATAPAVTAAASERATTAAAGAGSNGAVGQRSLAAP
jgi:predicted branched-subunit amino acid permease